LTAKHLHIVCLDVPYPVNHGGMFDLFYKLQYLQQAGVRIHLHCFEYGRGRQPALDQYCESVHYYQRKTGIAGLSATLPYIVSSRKSHELPERLLHDDHPILMEGIHCTWLLNDERFQERKKLVRLHNIEYQYYDQLSKVEPSWFRQYYFTRESRLLKKYEAHIAGKALFLAVSEKDAMVYRDNFNADAVFLPVFLPWTNVNAVPGYGEFCLYHGNLSVPENEHTAIWLLQNVINGLNIPFVIAGRSPSRKLRRLVNRSQQTCLAANPSSEEMQDLISKAHINILPSFNTTGVKLKLLHSLFAGRHCIVNRQAVEGSGLESCCHIADSATEMQQVIRSLLPQEFTDGLIADRDAILSRIYNNKKNCDLLTGWIW
jgi:hypothetical protein